MLGGPLADGTHWARALGLFGCLALGCSHPSNPPSDPTDLPASPSSSASSSSSPSRGGAPASTPSAAPVATQPTATEPATNQLTRFECSAPATRTRVEGRFLHKFVFQAAGIPLGRESEVIIHYAISALDSPANQRRFELVLTDHNGADVAFYEDLWRKGFQRGLLGIDIPFVIGQRGKAWCIEGRKQCPAKDPAERELASSLGEMAISVLPAQWLQQALNGRTSDGTLELELPDTLAHRLGFPVGKHLKLKQVGRGMPAQFALSRTVRAHMPDVYIMYGGSLDRFFGDGPHASRLTVDAGCSIRAIESSVERVMKPTPDIRQFQASWSARWAFSEEPNRSQ
jgi:hypothetical protein